MDNGWSDRREMGLTLTSSAAAALMSAAHPCDGCCEVSIAEESAARTGAERSGRWTRLCHSAQPKLSSSEHARSRLRWCAA